MPGEEHGYLRYYKFFRLPEDIRIIPDWKPKAGVSSEELSSTEVGRLYNLSAMDEEYPAWDYREGYDFSLDPNGYKFNQYLCAALFHMETGYYISVDAVLMFMSKGGMKLDLDKMDIRLKERFMEEFKEIWKSAYSSDKKGQSSNNDVDSDISNFHG